MEKKNNRSRLNNMSDKELSEFIFSEEFAYAIRKHGEGPEAFSKWLQESYDDEYPYKVVEMYIKYGNISASISNFNYGEIEVGDRLEIQPIENITYTLEVFKIVYPMHVGDQILAKARFVDSTEVPLSILSEIPYRGCKLIKLAKPRNIEVYLV